MGESLFVSEPKSLRMDRRSPEAARLREAVSKKLMDFLGNYSDEVLAEYIVVLVCNGKHQTQARDDLQAFLGEESGAFVSWLWNYLSEEFFTVVTPDVSDPKAKKSTKNNYSLDIEHKANTFTDNSHSIGPTKVKNGSFEPPSYHANSNHLKPPQVSEKLKSCSPLLDDLSAEANKEGLKADDNTHHKNSGSKNGNLAGTAKNITSSINCSHEVASVGKQSLHCELQNRKIQKISSSSVSSQHLPEPVAEQAAIGLRSVIAEELQLKPLSSTISAETRMLSNAADDLSHPTARLRGNVWDRLGRPHAHTQRSIKEEQSLNLGFIDGGKLDNHGEESQNPILTGISQVASSTRPSYAIDRGDSEGISLKVSGDIRSNKANNSGSLKRKIEESEFNLNNGTKGSYFQDKEPSQQQQNPLPIKNKSQQNMNKFARAADNIVSSDAKFGLNPTYTVPDSKDIMLSQPQVKKDSSGTPVKIVVPASTTLPANSKSHSRTDVGNANQKPIQDDMLAVKSKIQQIEIDMLKLRAKQVGRSIDGKQNMSSGLQNFSEESIESRTVLVANVHFAATKESLILHFGRCGTIAKVIMLTDSVTGLPKGAAYLVFANKESVDKALSLSGTSFFSRILKVVRKAEVPPDYLVPSQPSLKQQQPFYPQPYGKNPFQKPHMSSHLQWRRDQRSSGENSLTAPSTGLGSSSVE